MEINKVKLYSELNHGDIINHGIDVFGTEENFYSWLKKENFFFDKKAPIEFINTIDGIKFIDDRLVGIAYGDNA